MEQMRLDFDAAEKITVRTETSVVESSQATVVEATTAAVTVDQTPPVKAKEPAILSVSDVNKAVKNTLETGFKLLWIKGEISNFKAHTSGHFYFSLKDSKAQISAVMFRGFNQGMKFKPHDGLEVIVRGKITVYEPRGNYQVFCEMMEPVGAGALQVAFEQLKKKLEKEGLFDKARKRALPVLPKHVAVVTSPTGAAIRDILNVLGRRFRGLRVTVVPALVQGEASAPSVVAAIELAQRLSDVDVMIVGRGGGSIEDMWGFNDERVARAIAASRIPIISAVGHEIDFTIADFVADLRAPTPSAAAELVCRNASELQERIIVLQKRLLKCNQHAIDVVRHRLVGFSKRLIDPKRRLQDLALRCDELSQRLEMSAQRFFDRRRQNLQLLMSHLPSPQERIARLEQTVRMSLTKLESYLHRGMEARLSKWRRLSSLLDAVSPLKVVERGYSIARLKGQLVRSSVQLQRGDQIEVAFAKGKAIAVVEKTFDDQLAVDSILKE